MLLKHTRSKVTLINGLHNVLKSIEIRKELTDEWKRSGVEERIEYVILTDEITKAWAEMNTKEYKKFKSLKKENLRDNMSNLEIVLSMLGEVATTETLQSLRFCNVRKSSIF